MPLSATDQAYYDSLPVKGGHLVPTGRDVGGFKKELSRPEKVDPDYIWHYFAPSRFGVTFAPEWFRSKLKEMDPRLEVVWHPIRERWLAWVQDPNIKHPYCAGWKLIFPWENPIDSSYLPLDERLLANIASRRTIRHRSGLEYWDRIASEIMRDRLSKERDRQQLSRDIAGEYFDYRQISVAMRGHRSGSKFSESHSE